MTPFALSGIFISITGISMGTLVLIKTPGILTNRLWAYFNFAMAIWGFGAYKIGTAHDPQTALLWMKIGHVGVITIPVFFLHFASRFFEKVNKTAIISAYLLAAFFLGALLTNSFISHIEFIFNSFYYHTHPNLFYKIFFCLWLTSVVYAFFLAYINIKNVSEAKRNQIKYFFLITTIGYTGGIGNFLPVFGIMIYPYGNFLVTLYILLTTYVILKYNLLDITIVIRKSLIYSLLVTSITLIFFIFVLVSEHLFHQVVHYQNVNTSIIMAGLIALVFTPLKTKIQNLVDRAFFKATPIEMAQQNEQLRQNEKVLADMYSHADKLSKTDTLTQINNRRNFFEMLNKKMQDCETAKTCFYLVIFDVDHFKGINDTYGHALGDKALVKVVEVVKNNIRSNDFIGRYGGDEFIICLDFPNKEGILNRLTKISDGVKALRLPYEGKEIYISVSIGAAKFVPGTNITEEKLIEKADFELFNVKKATRGEISINE